MSRRLTTALFAFAFITGLAAAPQQTAPAQQSAPTAAPAAAPTIAPEPINTDLIATLRFEGLERSKVMWIVHNLTDVYGPRPVGTPNHVAAANWAIKTMESWGLTNGHLEPFKWRGEGWLPGRASGYITSPVKANLKFEAIPWSPSTNGTVSGQIVLMPTPMSPTDEELTAFFIDMAPKVKGSIVMVGAPSNITVNFNEAQKRRADECVKAEYAPRGTPTPAQCGGRGFGGGRGGTPTAAGRLSTQQVATRVNTFLRDNPPAFRLTQVGPGRIPGNIVAQNTTGQTYLRETQISPGVILRNEDYGRIARIIADGTPVSVEFNVTNQYFPEGSTSYVTVAEIPGTDKADEVVMLGGHLDSWTSATGATDNAIGCAIMMEAVRILKAAGVAPRRTIRVALWSGEEQGLLGSVSYVKEHFGSFDAPKPDFGKLQAYWNIDDGTGRVRGASIFGPPEAGQIIAQLLKPFEDWGVFGASSTTSRSQGGSDFGAFNEVGLPGIGADQDPIEYNSTTWHTNLDTYERIVPDDVMKNAVVSAALVYHLATRDALLPRFAAANMPALPGRGGGAAGGAGRGGATGPTAQPHVYFASKGRPLTVKAPGVLPVVTGAAIPATPPEPQTASVATQPAHGTLVMRADGSFVYTPAAMFTGTDTFTYSVRSGGAVTAPGTVTVVVK